MSATKFILACLFLQFSLSYSHSQVVDTTTIIHKIDFIGKNPWNAITASINASRNDVVVVLIRGGDQKLIDGTEGELKALVHNKYTRIGLVIADLLPDEHSPLITIVSNGTIYASIPDAKADTVTLWQVYNLVRDAYQDNIWPKTKNTGQKEK